MGYAGLVKIGIIHIHPEAIQAGRKDRKSPETLLLYLLNIRSDISVDNMFLEN